MLSVNFNIIFHNSFFASSIIPMSFSSWESDSPSSASNSFCFAELTASSFGMGSFFMPSPISSSTVTPK
nr:MAG TPA: hypothetical protein [Caudoviricetes sp.]